MGNQIAVIIDWYGPYSTLKSARRAARQDYGEGLYMLIGKTKNQKKVKLQYCGIAKDLAGRLNEKNHHKAKELTQSIEIWKVGGGWRRTLGETNLEALAGVGARSSEFLWGRPAFGAGGGLRRAAAVLGPERVGGTAEGKLLTLYSFLAPTF